MEEELFQWGCLSFVDIVLHCAACSDGMWRSRSTASPILNLVCRWRRVVRFTPRRFYTRESAPDTIWYLAGWLQSRSELFGEEVDPLPLSGIEPRFLGRLSRSLRTVPKVVPPGLRCCYTVSDCRTHRTAQASIETVPRMCGIIIRDCTWINPLKPNDPYRGLPHR
jgi:hypothetical protein